MSIVVTDTHVWYAGSTTNTVIAWNIETGVVDYETPNYGGTIRTITLTDSHVWYAGDSTQTVRG